MNFIDAYMAELRRPPLEFIPAPPTLLEPPEWPDRPAFQRELVVVPPPAPGAPALSLDAARQAIDAAIAGYLAEPCPERMLLVRAAPGVGKTHRAVRTAEVLADNGRRVLFAGPRHAFFADVLAEARRPELWYEWLPRQAGDPENGKPATCLHAKAVASWIAKGYDAMAFCSGICGWDYVNTACPWHRQKQLAGPIVFGQHAHVLAHPLRFDTVIGDESPISAFLHEWAIGARWIAPQGLDPASGPAHLLHTLASLSLNAKGLAGPRLLEQLGGSQRVLDACEEFSAAPDALPAAPRVRRPEDAETADYFHLPVLVGLLRREARANLAGLAYPERVILSDERLLLLGRRFAAGSLPPHVIWLDATANERLYEVAFGRQAEVVDAAPELQGRVFQVWSRANGKGSTAGELAVEQLGAQIRSIAGRYDHPAVITYQDLAARVAPSLPALHFYAARGTNAFDACDALIVAGTPMPSPDTVHKAARMLFAERTEPFDARWSQRLLTYTYVDPADAQGRAYPVGGFWQDGDLQALLWSYREAELIQAVHRGRPVIRDVDVWLLSNVPLPELPPARLVSLQELLDAPPYVNVFKWDAAMRVVEGCAERLLAEKGYVSSADLARLCVIDLKTANKYLGLLASTGEWVLGKACQAGRGRPGPALYPAAR